MQMAILWGYSLSTPSRIEHSPWQKWSDELPCLPTIALDNDCGE